MEFGLSAAFAAAPWWGYILAAIAGTGFGLLQTRLMGVVMGNPPRKWVLAVKLPLWVAFLVVAAILSIPLMLIAVLAATVTQLCGACVCYQKARKEAK